MNMKNSNTGQEIRIEAAAAELLQDIITTLIRVLMEKMFAWKEAGFSDEETKQITHLAAVQIDEAASTLKKFGGLF